MAKLTGPFLSLGAHGSFANCLTVRESRGVVVAQRKSQPTGEATPSQLGARAVMRWLGSLWMGLSTVRRQEWEVYALGKAFTGYNGLVAQNFAKLNLASDLSPLLLFPPRPVLPAPTNPVFTAANTTITFQATAPAPPVGWSIVQSILIVILNQSPHLAFVPPVSGNGANAAPWTVQIFGRTRHTSYYATGAFRFLSPEGVAHMGTPAVGIVTTT